jgi:hypothetical protein
MIQPTENTSRLATQREGLTAGVVRALEILHSGNAVEYQKFWQTLSLAQQREVDRIYRKSRRNRWLLRKVLPFSLIASWLIYKLFTDLDGMTYNRRADRFAPSLGSVIECIVVLVIVWFCLEFWLDL